VPSPAAPTIGAPAGIATPFELASRDAGCPAFASSLFPGCFATPLRGPGRGPRRPGTGSAARPRRLVRRRRTGKHRGGPGASSPTFGPPGARKRGQVRENASVRAARSRVRCTGGPWLQGPCELGPSPSICAQPSPPVLAFPASSLRLPVNLRSSPGRLAAMAWRRSPAGSGLEGERVHVGRPRRSGASGDECRPRVGHSHSLDRGHHRNLRHATGTGRYPARDPRFPRGRTNRTEGTIGRVRAERTGWTERACGTDAQGWAARTTRTGPPGSRRSGSR